MATGRPKVTTDPTDPDFPHGTNRGRQRGCKCPGCVDAARLMRKRNDLLRAQGKRLSFDANKVADHIDRLLAEVPEATLNTIRRATGLSKSAVVRIQRRGRDRVNSETGRALLALRAEDLRPYLAYVDRKLTVQQIRSMQAQGWTLRWQSARIGRTAKSMEDLVAGPGQMVTADTAKKIAELAAEVGDRQGPSDIARRVARSLGWYPAAMYDDQGNLDEDAATSIEVDPEQLRAEQGMEVLRFALRKLSVASIAEETGIAFEVVRKYKENARLMLSSHGGSSEFKDPEAAARVRDVLDHYEWDGWSARESLAKLDIPVHKPPRRGPKPGYGRGQPRSKKAA